MSSVQRQWSFYQPLPVPLPILRARSRTRRSIPRALGAASRTAPLLDIPVDIGLDILELALIETPPTTLLLVSKAFNALVSTIIYKTVVLDSLQKVALFHRTIASKPPDFLATHVKTLAVTAERYTSEARTQLEDIIAACNGLRTLVIPRPGVLAATRDPRATPTELVIQKFDAVTPFEWDPPFAHAAERPAAHLSAALTHLRVCEPGDVWHAPRAMLEFFGALPRLTHLTLARHVNAPNEQNDDVFVVDVRALLEARPALQMLVVSLFPAGWPRRTSAGWNLCSHKCICRALMALVDTDKRLVLLTAGWDTVFEEAHQGPGNWPYSPATSHGRRRLGGRDFWENWRMSDKRTVSLAAGWEPEISTSSVRWTYPALPSQLHGRHNFWKNWLMIE